MTKKTALIIGGSGGIGMAIAKTMVQKEIKVYASHYKAQFVETDLNSCHIDVTDIESVKKAISTITAEQAIDIVVYSASLKIENKPLLSLQWDDYSRHMDVQLKGLFNVLEALKEQLKLKVKTKFIVILTEYCIGKPPASLTHYITAKYALMGMAKSMAVELSKYNCTVNMISPGMTSTYLISNLPPKLVELTAMNNPLKRIAEPNDIASAVMFFAGDESDYLNGVNLTVNGGSTMN